MYAASVEAGFRVHQAKFTGDGLDDIRNVLCVSGTNLPYFMCNVLEANDS